MSLHLESQQATYNLPIRIYFCPSLSSLESLLEAIPDNLAIFEEQPEKRETTTNEIKHKYSPQSRLVYYGQNDGINNCNAYKVHLK